MYIVKFPAPTRGLFAVFIEAVRCIDFAVSNNLPYYVDVSESNSLYTDTERMQGDKNIWNYYFLQQQPLDHSVPIYSAGKYEGNTNRIWRRSHFKRIYNRAIRYLQFTPTVAAVLQQLTTAIPAKTLGVHVRRTDHYIEVPQVSIEVYKKLVTQKMQSGKFDHIFISTDDDTALAELKEYFGAYSVLSNEVTRSVDGTPVHKPDEPSSGYQLGLEALIDAYSLSLCSELILANSNFSYCSLYFNPNIAYTLLDGFNVKGEKTKLFAAWLHNLYLDARYHFFHSARLLGYYRRWKYFKKRFA